MTRLDGFDIHGSAVHCRACGRRCSSDPDAEDDDNRPLTLQQAVDWAGDHDLQCDGPPVRGETIGQAMKGLWNKHVASAALGTG
jgi:hypothetical protein